jgi:hypothetical protein
MKPYSRWLVIAVFFGGLVGGFFLLRNWSTGVPNVSVGTMTFASTRGSSSVPTLPPPIPPDGFKEYRNDEFGFSIFYPGQFEPREFIEHGPELTVLFQSGEGEPGFQIYLAPISEDQISPERFQRDMPSGIMQEPRDLMVDGAKAVTFYGFDAKVGKTSEVWFIKDHILFEVSTYKELSGWLSDIMQTWRFVPRVGENVIK